jgi:hypothetical protein
MSKDHVLISGEFDNEEGAGGWRCSLCGEVCTVHSPTYFLYWKKKGLFGPWILFTCYFFSSHTATFTSELQTFNQCQTHQPSIQTVKHIMGRRRLCEPLNGTQLFGITNLVIYRTTLSQSTIHHHQPKVNSICILEYAILWLRKDVGRKR